MQASSVFNRAAHTRALGGWIGLLLAAVFAPALWAAPQAAIYMVLWARGYATRYGHPLDSAFAQRYAALVPTLFDGQINAMQKALKEDEELVILFQSGVERVRVMEIFLPSPAVAVLTGTDSNRNLTRAIVPVDSLQLLCKTMKAPAGAKPVRVNLVTPKNPA